VAVLLRYYTMMIIPRKICKWIRIGEKCDGVNSRFFTVVIGVE
jgi:hypothetical protein